MVCMDIPMPESCSECEFMVFFEDDKAGCMQLVDDNGYGMPLIQRYDMRLKACPLIETDALIKEILSNIVSELLAIRTSIDAQLEILSKYLQEE